VSLAENLGLKVVAEGVETPDQVELLRQFGCHEAQGFGLARPMPADNLLAWHVARELAQAEPGGVDADAGAGPMAAEAAMATPTRPLAQRRPA